MLNTKRFFGLITAIALSFTLTACGGSSDNTNADDAKTTDTTQTEAAPAEDAQKDDAPSGEVKNKDTAGDGLNFGDTYQYEDGLKITFGKPEKFEPSEDIAKQLDSMTVRYKLKVTFENGSDKKLDLGLYSTTVKSGEKTGELFGDASQNVEPLLPHGDFEPGDTKDSVIGVAVENDEPLHIEFTILGDDAREKVVYK